MSDIAPRSRTRGFASNATESPATAIIGRSLAPSPTATVRASGMPRRRAHSRSACALAAASMIGPATPTGEPAVDDLEPVGPPEVEAEPVGERVEQLVESTGDDADDARRRRGRRRSSLGHARRSTSIRARRHRRSTSTGEPGERRDALAQALVEVELAAHRALGDLGDELDGEPACVREQFDDLVLG